MNPPDLHKCSRGLRQWGGVDPSGTFATEVPQIGCLALGLLCWGPHPGK